MHEPRTIVKRPQPSYLITSVEEERLNLRPYLKDFFTQRRPLFENEVLHFVEFDAELVDESEKSASVVDRICSKLPRRAEELLVQRERALREESGPGRRPAKDENLSWIIRGGPDWFMAEASPDEQVSFGLRVVRSELFSEWCGRHRAWIDQACFRLARGHEDALHNFYARLLRTISADRNAQWWKLSDLERRRYFAQGILNATRDLFREVARHPKMETLFEFELATRDDPVAAAQLQELIKQVRMRMSEDQARLFETIFRMDKEQRAVVFSKGSAVAEIAKHLGMTVEKVYALNFAISELIRQLCSGVVKQR